jgi:cysteinyl-tRNA synthetase
VTVLRGEEMNVYSAGEQFTFAALRRAAPRDAAPDDSLRTLTDDTLAAFRRALRDHQPAAAVGYVHSLIELIRVRREAGAAIDALEYVQLMVREMLAVLAIWLEAHSSSAEHAGAPQADPLVGALAEVLIAERAALRAGKQYAQADKLRADLLAAGIVLTDTPQGTTWARIATTDALENRT